MGNEGSRAAVADDAPLPKQRVVKLTEDGTLQGGTAAEAEIVQQQAQNKAESYKPPFVVLGVPVFSRETDLDHRFTVTLGRSRGSRLPTRNNTNLCSLEDDCEAVLHVLPRLSDVSSEWPLLEQDTNCAYSLPPAKLRAVGTTSRGGRGSEMKEKNPLTSSAAPSSSAARNTTTGLDNAVLAQMAETLDFTVSSARDYLRLEQWPANLFVPDQQLMRWPLALELRPGKRVGAMNPTSSLPLPSSDECIASGMRQRAGAGGRGRSDRAVDSTWVSTTSSGQLPGDTLPPEGTLLYFFGIRASSSTSQGRRRFEPKVVEKFLVGPNQKVFHVQDLFGGDTEDGDCVICYSAPTDTFVMPCKHLCLCSDCAMTMQLRMLTTQNGQTAVRCPLCRGDIANCIRLDGRNLAADAKMADDDEPAGTNVGNAAAGPQTISAKNKKLADEILDAPVAPRDGSTWLPWLGREDYKDGDVASHNPLVRRNVEGLRSGASGSRLGENRRDSAAAGFTPDARRAPPQDVAAVGEGTRSRAVAAGTASGSGRGASRGPPSPTSSAGASRHSRVAAAARGGQQEATARPLEVGADGGAPVTGGGSSSSSLADSIAQAFATQRAEGDKPLPARAWKRVKAELTHLNLHADRLRSEGFTFRNLNGSDSTIIPPPSDDSSTAATSPPLVIDPQLSGRFLEMCFLTEKIAADSSLGRELRRGGVAHLTFELMFTSHFPMEAPKVRLVSPTATGFWVQQHGSLCMEMLSADGWSPVISLEQLAFSVRAMMANQSGTIYANTSYDVMEREKAHDAAAQIDRSHRGNYGNMNS